MHLIIDNYDSFTYNIVQCFRALGADVEVRRNDEVTLNEIEALQPETLVISPGPCSPTEAGISNAAVVRFARRIPMLGVCLGHQCLAYTFGGKVRQAEGVFHGKTSLIRHDGTELFEGLPSQFRVARYHSLVVRDLPDDLVVTSRVVNDDGTDGEIMSMRHRTLPLWSVQFHPESIMTNDGMRMFSNYLRMVEARPTEMAA